jgi:cardiolipin synthase
MRPISQRALISAYLRNDAQIDGAEMASLVRAQTQRRPDTAHSARIAEFANPLDAQVQRLVKGTIPGAELILTPGDRKSLQRRIDLATSPTYANAFTARVAKATNAPERDGNELKFLVDGPEVYPELRRMIRDAKETLDMEFFTLHPDATGQQITNELIAAAKKGVRVNLLLDYALSVPAADLIKQLKAGGVHVITFNNGYKHHPITHLSKVLDHRKIVLVDGQEGMVGGMNLGTPYEKFWHDTMTTVKGPILKDIYREFATNWTSSGGPFPDDAIALADKRALPIGQARAAIQVTTPTDHQALDGLNTAIDNATDHIYVSSPYLIDGDIVNRLIAAAKRGVRVVAVCPNETDAQTVDMINRFRVNDMLAAGIQVRYYDSTNPDLKPDEVNFMKIHLNHAKLITVDGVWSAVGTVNLDRRALKVNQEMNMAVTSPAFAHDIERRFFNADAVSGNVSLATATRYSPLQSHFRKKLAEKLAPYL